ncbi:4-coumarate--CoA ligase 1-like [Nylanderia fulva]|uniref:4-coumarate--CoA ligase 1-like n=1 Tax=Nylanderia fulva TaxID=613905 RepID=UPI0010FAF05C|nr:4-coumarate--CoA ligase 1-like [Nylanderia fulva]
MWFSSLYWISGIMMNLKSIVQGAKAIIYPEFNEEMTCTLIEKYKITVIFLSPSMINRFLKTDYLRKYSLSTLKIINSGGAVIDPKVQEEIKHILPHVQMLQGYGMTEVCGFVTFQLPHHKAGSCGTVVQNAKIKIVDPETGKILDPNNPGELWMKTAIIMNGYYRNLEATKNIIDEEGKKTYFSFAPTQHVNSIIKIK